MTSNSVESCALRLASVKMDKNETVHSYALRFRSLSKRFGQARFPRDVTLDRIVYYPVAERFST